MKSRLPVIVGFGGYNAAGRSSGHQAYKRMIFDSLGSQQKAETVSSLSNLMGLSEPCEEKALQGTLVRRIEANHFDVDNTRLTKKFTLEASQGKAASFSVSRRQLPSQPPANWQVEPLDEEGKHFRVTILDEQEIKIDTFEPIAIKTAGQLPSGFDPGDHYRSLHHPRGLQMAVMGASDAVKSIGISWRDIVEQLSPDEVSVYSASLMCQLDDKGFGGLFNGRLNGDRTSSKQVALGFNSMPADFINAYVLGSMGATAASAGACATYLYNLRQGVEDIRSGRRKVSIVGASEAPIIPAIIDGYAAMGALATDLNLLKLDGGSEVDHRRASRPFGNNTGFTLAESTQYTVLMSDEFAMELGAKIYGSVPGVYVNADGFKKSISAPGPGNYITMAKAMGLARTLLGEESVQRRSFVQAHGSSTPQNRVTESRIFDSVATAFGIENWPICAVKSYLGHTLGAASGDQLAATLGVFAHGVLPGIKTMSSVADDVFAERLNISVKDLELGEGSDVAFINSKGFGGNNATATVFSPDVTAKFLEKKYGKSAFTAYQHKRENTELALETYLSEADSGALNPIYEFGTKIVDESQIKVSSESISIPGFAHDIDLEINEGFDAL